MLERAAVEASAILNKCRLFSRIEPPARARLAQLAVTRRAPAGKILFCEGDACPGMYIVGAGLCRVYKVAPSGKEHVLHVAGPGATFAEAAVLGGFACPAYAQALEDSELALIPAGALRGFLEGDHRACIDLLAGMAAWLHQMVDLLEDVVLRDAAGRVARQLSALADDGGRVHLPAARKTLASQLNLTPETLSRTLRRLSEDGCISSERDAIVILDRGRLEAVVEGHYPEV